MERIQTNSLFDISKTIANKLLCNYQYPWEALNEIESFIISLGSSLPSDKFCSPIENVWISKDVFIPPTAAICAPTIICHKTEIRHGAYIRGRVIVGEECVVGNSCEIKNSIIFDKAQIAHFNYIGDSIIGYKAHTGAGAITSNVKNDKSFVSIKFKDKKINTELKKLGAMIGDNAEIGCNAVLNPGSIIGQNTVIYPLSSVRGYVPANSIYKSADNIVKIQTKG